MKLAEGVVSDEMKLRFGNVSLKAKESSLKLGSRKITLLTNEVFLCFYRHSLDENLFQLVSSVRLGR